MPRYEFVEGSSAKFWEIEISGASVTTRWGRIGTAGQEKTKDFASAEKTQAEYDGLVREKTGKGYKESGAAESRQSVSEPEPSPARPHPPTPSPIAPPSPGRGGATTAAAVPEVLAAAEPGIAWTPELRALVLPRRGGDVRPAPLADPVAAWQGVLRVFAPRAGAWKVSRNLAEPDLAPLLRAVFQKLEGTAAGSLPPTANPETEAVLLAVLSVPDWKGPELGDELVTVWEATAGLAFAVEALQAFLDFEVMSVCGAVWLNRRRVGEGVAERRPHWWFLRHRLALAGETEWAAARDTAARLRGGAPLGRRVALAYLFPETGWAEEDARDLLAPGQGEIWMASLLLPAVRDAGLVSGLVERFPFSWFGVPSSLQAPGSVLESLAATWLDTLGAGAVKPLVSILAHSTEAALRRQVLAALEAVRSAEAATVLAGQLELREGAAAMAGYAVRFPREALPALAARAGRGGPCAPSLLVQMVRRDPGLAAELAPALPEASRRAVEAALGQAELLSDAAPGDLPPVLTRPPWQREGKRKPPRMAAFWRPADFARPLLRGRRAALPLAAVETLGTVLSISPLDEPYAGLEQVREACDPASLGAFAWDLFFAWWTSGAASKEQWAFHALGHLGDDACARRLAPLVRQWPGEAAHARAVTGLDVLRTIGTDVALMHLHGISQKLKFKGLQEKAKEKIAEVAEQRGLAPEDLADRLVPDLGLGADGTLVLDFGPRSFRVGFDELLKPFVRDGEGKRLSDLPKPGKADAAEKAGEAQETWKTLKKDAKALAGHQIVRLELAMCSRRRWEPDVFRTFFLEHPLLQHLVRRLVWGAWERDTLAATFRVSEDGSLADAEDEAWELPEGVRVGIVHRLDLDDALASRWGEVLADYEILQPFAQLGRELYPMTEEERGALELKRVEGRTVPTGKVLGLADQRGWRRGPAMDAGWIGWFAKPLPGGEHEIRLALEPGVIVGMVMEEPEQKLGTVTIDRAGGDWDNQGGRPFGSLDAVTFSELVRDLEGLR